jgi:hypothetical protein
MARQALKPCSGWGPLRRITSTRVAVSRPMAAASRRMRSWVHPRSGGERLACAQARWRGGRGRRRAGGSDALALVEQLDGAGGDAGFDLLAQQAVRHRAVVAVDVDVIVERDTAAAPLGIEVGLHGQGGQRRPVEFVGQLAAADLERRIGRPFNSSSNALIAAFSSAREKKRWLRRRARIQRSTTCTPTSTLALSRGRRGRSGRIAVP